MQAIHGRLRRRTILAALPAALYQGASFAQAFPSRALTLVCPFPAGGTADVQLRALAAAAAKELGQAVVVETKPGAAGTLGPASIVNAAPDGYTLAQATAVALLRQPHIQPTRYDPARDFTYIIGATRFEAGLLVRSDAPWRNLAEFVADARKRPGRITYGTAGPATAQHTAMLRLCELAGIQCNHIPFKGSIETFNALLAGHIDSISETSGWAPHLDAGKFRALAMYSDARLKRWPAVPTAKEQGYEVVESVPWGIVGPAGMTAHVTQMLHAAFGKALSDPGYLKTLQLLGQEPWGANSQAYRSFMLARIPVEREVVEKYKLKESQR